MRGLRAGVSFLAEILNTIGKVRVHAAKVSCFIGPIARKTGIFRQNSQHYRESVASSCESVVFYRYVWGFLRAGPRTRTLSRMLARTPPDAERQWYFFSNLLRLHAAVPFFRADVDIIVVIM